MQMLQVLCLIWAVVKAQNNDDDLSKLVGDILGKNKKEDQLNHLIEVTSTTSNGFGALDRCGEGKDQGVHICVPYHQCDGVTKMVIQDGRTDGFGLIDIRFGASECEAYLDVCCGLPAGSMREPGVVVPVDPVQPPSSSPLPPVVTPTSAPVSPEPPLPPRPSSVYCGIRNPNGIDFKITGNKDNEAEYGEFPWMVAILRINFDPARDKTLAICGGSLIAPNVVLTGAHCVADLQLNQYKVRAGEWDTQTEKERLPYQERTVKQAIIHEDFAPSILYNNVALLILSSPFTQADNIGTICLPNQNEVITARNCLASGWGKDVFGKQGTYQVILKKIELPIVPFDACQQALRTTRLSQSFKLHASFICAGGEQGKDTCTGDGGSPLICPDPKTPGRYVQSGIVSWGIGCGEKNIPGVYADVAKFRTWIDGKLSRLNIDTDPYKV